MYERLQGNFFHYFIMYGPHLMAEVSIIMLLFSCMPVMLCITILIIVRGKWNMIEIRVIIR